jgi:hypothetical protein
MRPILIPQPRTFSGRGAGLNRLRKKATQPCLPVPRVWGDGSALCVFKQMQILRRLLAPQNDIIRSLFPQPV